MMMNIGITNVNATVIINKKLFPLAIEDEEGVAEKLDEELIDFVSN